MARTRNLKPSFFLNEVLAACEPLARLLFAGLWCWADVDGRLEDRPLRIKAAVLPFDQCDVDALLNVLHQAGLIVRYAAGQIKAIQIVSWEKHGNPHPKEPSLGLPSPCVDAETSRDLSGLILKDSLCLNALTLTQNTPLPPEGGVVCDLEKPPEEAAPKRRTRTTRSLTPLPGFEEFWAAYPRGDDKQEAIKAWNILAPDLLLQQAIMAGLTRQKQSDQWLRGFIPYASKFLRKKHWENEGVVLPKLSAPATDPAAEMLARRKEAERQAQRRTLPPHLRKPEPPAEPLKGDEVEF